MDGFIAERYEREQRWLALRRLKGCIDAVAPVRRGEDCVVAVLAGIARRVGGLKSAAAMAKEKN